MDLQLPVQSVAIMLWVWIPLRRGVLDTTLCDQVCQWLVTGWWFSPGTPVSSTNKTDRHNIAEILLKVVLNTMNQTKPNKTNINKTITSSLIKVSWLVIFQVWEKSDVGKVYDTVRSDHRLESNSRTSSWCDYIGCNHDDLRNIYTWPKINFSYVGKLLLSW